MVSQQHNLDTIANNLANVNTTAFKQQRAQFQDLVYQTFRASGATGGGSANTPQATQIGLGSRFASSSTSFNLGTFQPSGDPMHMAINGDGFFQVTLPDGTAAYTRDGSLHTDANGQLVTSSGFAVQPAITIPANTQSITIGRDGVVSVVRSGSTASTQVGTLQLANFVNPAGLLSMGENLYTETTASGTASVNQPGSNGLGLLNLPAGVNYAVTGGVLILAATVDAVSRKRAGGSVIRT